MLILNRRDFIKNATVFGALAATGIARGASDEVGKPYPGWKPGEMDLHFVYTGCGENMFYRLPDGNAYRIYLLEAHDESMNVLSVVEKKV